MMRFNEAKKNSKGWPRGEDWTLGDSPAVSLLKDPNADTDFFTMMPAPHFGAHTEYINQPGARQIRVYTHVDGRIILADMFAKMQLNYGKQDK